VAKPHHVARSEIGRGQFLPDESGKATWRSHTTSLEVTSAEVNFFLMSGEKRGQSRHSPILLCRSIVASKAATLHKKPPEAAKGR
jgi:hypothetical protein